MPQSLSQDILSGLYQFFNSDGCRVWLELGSVISGSPFKYSEYDFTNEEPALCVVHRLLLRWSGFITPQWTLDSDLPRATVNWAIAAAKNSLKLGEQVGKASAELWLYGDCSATKTCNAFCLAMKYFCKSHDITLNNPDHV